MVFIVFFPFNTDFNYELKTQRLFERKYVFSVN